MLARIPCTSPHQKEARGGVLPAAASALEKRTWERGSRFLASTRCRCHTASAPECSASSACVAARARQSSCTRCNSQDWLAHVVQRATSPSPPPSVCTLTPAGALQEDTGEGEHSPGPGMGMLPSAWQSCLAEVLPHDVAQLGGAAGPSRHSCATHRGPWGACKPSCGGACTNKPPLLAAAMHHRALLQGPCAERVIPAGR